MSEKKKSFREFLANDALNPGVTDDKLQKVDVGSREAEDSNKDDRKDKVAAQRSVPKIKQKPVALFGILCLMFLGLTIGLSFVSLWALFGIIPTLLCFWKMVLNNADNNYKSVVDRYDSDYLERIDSKEKEKQKCQEMEQEIEEKKEEAWKKYEAKLENEKEKIEEKKEKREKNGKNGKSKDKDEDDIDDFDDDDEEEEEEKNGKKAEKSDKKFGSKVEKSGKRDVENENSRTSLIERNRRIRGQRAIY